MQAPLNKEQDEVKCKEKTAEIDASRDRGSRLLKAARQLNRANRRHAGPCVVKPNIDLIISEKCHLITLHGAARFGFTTDSSPVSLRTSQLCHKGLNCLVFGAYLVRFYPVGLDDSGAQSSGDDKQREATLKDAKDASFSDKAWRIGSATGVSGSCM